MGERHVLVISCDQILKQLSNLNEIHVKLEIDPICKMVAVGLFERHSSIKVWSFDLIFLSHYLVLKCIVFSNKEYTRYHFSQFCIQSFREITV